MNAQDKYRRDGEQAAEQHRKIQARIAETEAKRGEKEEEKPMQAGGRKFPEPPMPEIHLDKPGIEAELPLQPFCDAPYYKGSEKLLHKAAIITGGDSGIGRSVAILFAREGADIAIVYLSEHGDAAATKALVEKEGRRCILIPGDVCSMEFCLHAVQQTMSAFCRLDVLVNNAAFQMHVPDFMDLDEEQFDLTMKTNMYGYYHMARACIPHMKPGSAIVNCGSVTGLLGNKDLLDYSTTKGAIHTFTRSLGTHLIPKGIRVNAVAPGPVWTPLNPADKNADVVKNFGADSQMKRPAQPEEIAPAFVFLASPHCSSYITGEVLPVIGGYSGG
jgi:NAD(P)-dependent dehydrogenase (short-subunit alcohol dehydrogenase family)